MGSRGTTRITICRWGYSVKPTMAELNAGNQFRDSMIDRADGRTEEVSAPYWYGWVIMEAFLAGVEYEKKN